MLAISHRSLSTAAPLAVALALVLLAGACTTPDVETGCSDEVVAGPSPDADLDRVHTFAVLPASEYPEDLPEDLPKDSRVSLDTANKAAVSELKRIGLQEVDPKQEEPDAWLFSVASSETKTGTTWRCVPDYVWWGGWGWTWDPCAWYGAVEFDYEVGTVIVGLADPKTENVLFGGSIKGALACGEATKRIQDGVVRVFANYPTRS